jgi:hypothetical protein
VPLLPDPHPIVVSPLQSQQYFWHSELISESFMPQSHVPSACLSTEQSALLLDGLSVELLGGSWVGLLEGVAGEQLASQHSLVLYPNSGPVLEISEPSKQVP